MSKPTITRLFVASLLAIAGGLVLFFGAAWFGYVNGAFLMSGPDVIGIQPGGPAWTVLAMVAVGILAIAGGALAQFIAWIAAVLNTAQLQDKTWFLVLLLLGLLSFGFVAMVFYLVAGPDGTATVPGRLAVSPQPTA